MRLTVRLTGRRRHHNHHRCRCRRRPTVRLTLSHCRVAHFEKAAAGRGNGDKHHDHSVGLEPAELPTRRRLLGHSEESRDTPQLEAKFKFPAP